MTMTDTQAEDIVDVLADHIEASEHDHPGDDRYISDATVGEIKAAHVEITRLRAELEARDWKPIDTAPRQQGAHIGLLTAAGSLVRAHWIDLDGETSGWGAVTEGEHPSCWTDGFCWLLNADNEPSDPPLYWIELPSTMLPSPSSLEQGE